MKRARRMGLHPRHDLSNPTRRCVEATIRQGLSRITAPILIDKGYYHSCLGRSRKEPFGDQELVADESAAPADEDRRTAGQARPVLLALIGGGTSEPAAVWRHAAEDLGAACARWVALPGRGSTVFGSKKVSQEQCRPERRSVRSTNVCERTDEPWLLSAEVMCRVQREKTGRRGCILSRYQGENGNPG